MPKRTLHLVAYDIAVQATRTRALKACKAYGLGGQKSVHECLLTEGERRELEAALSGITGPASDSILVQRFGAGTEIECLGQAEPPPQPPWFYVG